jgi:SAM-dependent methyltransferase
VLDIGCGGGLWTVFMAKFGYTVTGTDHHSGAIEAAKRRAIEMGVANTAEFIVDDIGNSAIPSGYAPKIICISVTPTLPDDNAFRALIAHLDRISKNAGRQPYSRRVVLGQNRWEPSRLDAARSMLETAGNDFVLAAKRLSLVDSCWWMQPRHLEIIKEYFSSVTLIDETWKPRDGVRTEYLLE